MTPEATAKLNLGRRQAPARRYAQPPPLLEAPVKQPVQPGRRQLYGAYCDSGVSIEWHDFEPSKGFEWSRSFQPRR